MSQQLGTKPNDICNLFGCKGLMRFIGHEYHILDRNITEKCDVAICPKCGVMGLSRSEDN